MKARKSWWVINYANQCISETLPISSVLIHRLPFFQARLFATNWCYAYNPVRLSMSRWWPRRPAWVSVWRKRNWTSPTIPVIKAPDCPTLMKGWFSTVLSAPKCTLFVQVSFVFSLKIRVFPSKKLQFVLFKVHIFWEGHRILQNLHLTFDWHYIGQNFVAFSEYMNFL